VYQPHLKYTLKFFQSFTSRPRFFITTLYISLRSTFLPVPVKGLYHTKEYSLLVMQLIRIYATWGYFCFSHVKRGVCRYCACEILFAIPIDGLRNWQSNWGFIKYDSHATCILIFFSIDCSEEMWLEKKTRVKYHLSIKRMCPVVEFVFFNHIILFLFFTSLRGCRYWEILIASQTPLTGYATGIYQVRYTC